MNSPIKIEKFDYFSWTFIIGCFFYPITAIIILSIGLPTTNTNIFLKTIYCAFYIYCIFLFVKDANYKVNKNFLYFFLFFFIYSIRLIYDVSIRKIPFSSGSTFYVYSYFFGATLIPCLALFSTYRYFNKNLFLKNCFIIVVISNVFILIYVFFSGSQSYLEMLAGRMMVQSSNEIGTEATFLNPITISQTGASLVLLSVFNLLRTNKITYKFLSFILIFLGFFNLLIGASRGPLLFLFLMLLGVIFHHFYWMKKNLHFYVKVGLFFLFIIGIYNIVLTKLFSNIDIFLFERVEMFFEQRQYGEKEERDFLYQAALRQFYDNPILGDQYVINDGFGYPHNIILEVLMSTGIVGGSVFLIVILKFIYKIINIIKIQDQNIFFVTILALFIFSSGFTSGSLFVNPEIWLSLTLILTMPVVQKD